jgi:hypothetical protein
MKVIYIENVFINIDNITALQVVDESNDKVKIIFEGPKWCSYHYIFDVTPDEVAIAIKRCLDSNNKIEDLILKIRTYQRESEERRAYIDASLRSYI